MTAMANMRERIALRIDPTMPIAEMNQRLTREVTRRAQRNDFRNSPRGGRETIAGTLSHRAPRQNRTQIDWQIQIERKKVIMVLMMIVDVQAMGGSSNEARRTILGWFRGL